MKNIKQRLDPGLVEILDSMKDVFPLDLDNDLEGSREVMHGVAVQSVESGASITDVERLKYEVQYKDRSYKVPLYVYRPVNEAKLLPVVYWMHGGGLVTGEVKQDEFLLKRLVQTLNCVIVVPEYRLAPEFPFPIPLEDCYTGLTWVFDSADELNIDIDTKRIAIAGASAGGGITAALAQLVRDRDEFAHPLIFQLLMYPMLDDRNTVFDGKDDEEAFIWTKQNNFFGWSSYVGGTLGTDKTPKYASASRMENLENLPPALIMVGGIDLFVSECIEYAKRLNETGVSTELHVYPGGTHGYETLVPDIRISEELNSVVRNVLNHK